MSFIHCAYNLDIDLLLTQVGYDLAIKEGMWEMTRIGLDVPNGHIRTPSALLMEL